MDEAKCHMDVRFQLTTHRKITSHPPKRKLICIPLFRLLLRQIEVRRHKN
ncbi:hypothetical protein M7I_0743 [Glarea lozoyensis 74030]|uniref:Uncharacterized protein n=1 Tax=Glarea lozoyensis (strain ATCC 74030 / MF5533) TaxID=1104152 RepID=H0EE71_GLAL7|nr:hypothetical protein M7I_0743 [Glarea lozoyensis 74030]